MPEKGLQNVRELFSPYARRPALMSS